MSMIERADQQLDNVSRDFSLFGDLNGKINEQLDVISESGEALLGTKFDVYKPMVETFQNLFSNLEEKSSGLLGPLQPIYNQLSKQKGLLGLLGISSIGALGGDAFYERESFGIADQFEISYLESLIENDPERWSKQSQSLKILFDIYANLDTALDGENLADILGQSDVAEHPLKSVKFEAVVSSVMDFHGVGKNISPEFLHGTVRGKKYVEKNGDQLILKQLSRQDVRDICKSCIVQLWTPESLSLLRLTKAGDQVEGINYGNTYVAGVFSMLVGMNPNHVFYNTGDIQSEIVSDASVAETGQTTTDAPEAVVYSGNLNLDNLNEETQLGSIRFEQASILATRVFGEGPATDLLIRLSGGYPQLINRVISLGNHEGGLKFARTNADPNTASGQINRGTFQLSAQPDEIVNKVNRGLSEGTSMLIDNGIDYSLLGFEPLDSYKGLEGKSQHIKAQYDLLAWLGFAKNHLDTLADPNLQGQDLANYISNKVQVGISAIGEGVNTQISNNTAGYYLGRSDFYENLA